MDDKTPSARRRSRLLIVSLAVCGLLTIGVAAWYFRGRTVWTDGLGLHAADVVLRQVVWTAPEPIEPPIPATADEQQYEPALSPDGTEFYFVLGKPAGAHAHIYASYRRENQLTTPAPP